MGCCNERINDYGSSPFCPDPTQDQIIKMQTDFDNNSNESCIPNGNDIQENLENLNDSMTSMLNMKINPQQKNVSQTNFNINTFGNNNNYNNTINSTYERIKTFDNNDDSYLLNLSPMKFCNSYLENADNSDISILSNIDDDENEDIVNQAKLDLNDKEKYDASLYASVAFNNLGKANSNNNKTKSNKNTGNLINSSNNNIVKVNTDIYASIMSSTFQGAVTNNISNNEVVMDQNMFTKKTWAILYFEIDKFMLWKRDHFKTIYPDLNLVLIIQINDDKNLQEKVFLNKTKNDNFKYNPILSKRDLNSESKKHRCCIQLDLSEFSKKSSNSNNNISSNPFVSNNFNTSNLDISNPIKISLKIISYTNGKTLAVCYDELYLQLSKQNENVKYNYYQNLLMKYSNKKVGNLQFSFIYSLVDTSELNLLTQNSYIWNNFFSKIQYSKLFEFKSELMFKYNSIENTLIKDNGNTNILNNPINKKNYETFQTVSFDMNICEELKNKNLSLDRLLELFSMAKNRYEFYDVLYVIDNNYMNKQAFSYDKLLLFKEMIINLLESITSNNRLNDKILVPQCFKLLKKAFFVKEKKKKNKKPPVRRDSVNSIHNLINNSTNSILLGETAPIITERDTYNNSKLMKSALEIALKMIKNSTKEDITITCTNYIYAHFEESVIMIIDDTEFNNNNDISNTNKNNSNNTTTLASTKKISSDQYTFILLTDETNKYYELLGQTLVKMYEYQDCVEPLIMLLSKILKIKKIDISKIPFLLEKKTLDRLIKIQECNSIIIYNFFQIIYNYMQSSYLKTIFELVSIKRIKELVVIYKNIPFDSIHEVIIQFIRGMLTTVDPKIPETPKISFIKEQEHIDLIDIFSIVLILIKNKISAMNETTLIALMNSNFLNYWYSFCNILNNIEFKNSSAKVKDTFSAKKIGDLVIESLYICHEKKTFHNIDITYQNDYSNNINLKTMILRAMFHCITLVNNLYKYYGIKLVSYLFFIKLFIIELY